MNTNLTIRTEAALQDTKFADLATIYNEFATELDIKPIKKFRDNPTGIKRVLDIQAKYSEALPEQAEPEAKDPVQDYIDNGGEVEQCPPQKNPKPKAPTSKSAVKSEKSTRSGGERKPANSFSMNVGGSRIVYDIPTTLVSVVKTTDKADSMVGTLIQAIEASLEPTVKEVADYVINNYERPKSAKEVDRSFVIRKIKRAVQKGYLKLESA
jgi:hypothetical protein